MRISLKPRKSFIGYSSINLLGRKVDGFKLRIIKNRVKVIRKICFLKVLKELKTYLGLINYLRSGVGYYT